MIGVFDSGSGGLTVLRALTGALPERSFIYLGDHAGAPYGERSPQDIEERTRKAVLALFEQGCRLVILACNTAAAVSLRNLQRGWLAAEHPDKRVLGVLIPVIEAITGVNWNDDGEDGALTGDIVVFATRRTVESNAFKAEILKRAPCLNVVQIACPRLVGLIENRAPVRQLEEAVCEYAAPIPGLLQGGTPRAAILGCTHYPLIADLFAKAIHPDAPILSQPDLAAERLVDYLRRHPDIDDIAPRPSVRFLTSGDAKQASALASAFWRQDIVFESWAR